MTRDMSITTWTSIGTKDRRRDDVARKNVGRGAGLEAKQLNDPIRR